MRCEVDPLEVNPERDPHGVDHPAELLQDPGIDEHDPRNREQRDLGRPAPLLLAGGHVDELGDERELGRIDA